MASSDLSRQRHTPRTSLDRTIKTDSLNLTRLVGDFLKMGHLRPPFVYFQSFQANNANFTKNKCENVHPVFGTRIRTHVFLDVSLFP